jgi:hypothetical protein
MQHLVYAVVGLCSTRSMQHTVYVVLGLCSTRSMQYSVYAVLGLCSTRSIQYSVYAVLGLCSTRCMLCSLYAVLSAYCIRCMVYSAYAVLTVNSWSSHREIDRDDLTLGSAMMVQLWTRKREMGDEDENDVEDTRGYLKLWVRLAWLGWEDLISVNWTPDQNSYLPYWWWQIDSHTIFS